MAELLNYMYMFSTGLGGWILFYLTVALVLYVISKAFKITVKLTKLIISKFKRVRTAQEIK